MSLIEEALRRLQEPLIRTDPMPQDAPPKSPPKKETSAVHSWSTTTPAPAPTSTPTTFALVAVAVAVLALTGVLIVGGTFWIGRTLGRSQPQRATANTLTITTPESAAPLEATPTTAATAATSHPPQPKPLKTAAAVPVHPQNTPVLSGVVEGLGEPYAVINGRIVGIGEQVGEATLLEIAHGSVKLRRADGQEVVLSVPR